MKVVWGWPSCRQLNRGRNWRAMWCVVARKCVSMYADTRVFCAQVTKRVRRYHGERWAVVRSGPHLGTGASGKRLSLNDIVCSLDRLAMSLQFR